MRIRPIWLPGVFGVTAVPEGHHATNRGELPPARIARRAGRKKRLFLLAALLMTILLAAVTAPM